MNNFEALLKNDERVVFSLRNIYSNYGYKRFKMSKFEEYDFYSKNKDSLVSDGIITFTDTDGKLLALKPDVTLSIIKNSKDGFGVCKYFYNENVYRISKTTRAYKEIMQMGLECIGDISQNEIEEALLLALESLKVISSEFRLCVSSIDLVTALLCEYGVDRELYGSFFEALKDKNSAELEKILTAEQYASLSALLSLEGSYESYIKNIRKISKSEASSFALNSLEKILSAFSKTEYRDKISLDFSFTTNDGYYNGIVFKGFIKGASSAVISGGQYDTLMRRMGRKSSAIGFAVYLDEVERLDAPCGSEEKDEYINVALPKGRLGEKVYGMFERAGLECPEIKENTRKLIYENPKTKMRFFWVKPSDVAIYVERGCADIGVAGKDILLEYSPDIFELLDLKIGNCRMAVAAENGFCDDESKTLRVGTKFSSIAKEFYKSRGRDIEIIHLNGSIELAPILKLSDVIVDIVETGKTLLENNLSPIETIANISARLVSNKASYSFKGARIEEIKKLLSDLMVN